MVTLTGILIIGIVGLIMWLFEGPQDKFYRCPHCYKKFRVPYEIASIKRGTCPYCEKTITIN